LRAEARLHSAAETYAELESPRTQTASKNREKSLEILVPKASERFAPWIRRVHGDDGGIQASTAGIYAHQKHHARGTGRSVMMAPSAAGASDCEAEYAETVLSDDVADARGRLVWWSPVQGLPP
jgi:hypothetical protein